MEWCLRSVCCDVPALVTKIPWPKVQAVLFNAELSAAEQATSSAALQQIYRPLCSSVIMKRHV